MKKIQSENQHTWFMGGGEMGELVRSLDWQNTPLGPTDKWPQSLRTAVSMIFSSRFPMYIVWGKEYIQLYNDDFRPILGVSKHPAALGNRSDVTFSESWHLVGPMFDEVMQGKTVGLNDAMFPVDRYGYLEECYFTFSYSPIRDETGNVGGILNTVTETTQSVISSRRLQMLSNLASCTLEAKREDEVWEKILETLEVDDHDLPFVLLYVMDEEGKKMHLKGCVNLESGTDVAPLCLNIDETASWPVKGVLSHGSPEHVDDLESRFGSLPGGPWPESAHEALLVPLMRSGQTSVDGLLVAGISPRRALDEAYKGFLEMVGNHIEMALNNLRAYEEDRNRAVFLAELDQNKTAFFYHVSHEFRTPLTLLLGPVKKMLEQGAQDLSAFHREQLEVVHRNGVRLLKLINTMLDFSWIEAGRVRVLYEPVFLSEYTAELASVFRSAIERAGLELDVDCAPLPEVVYVDRSMWEKIVFNLLSNALKFTLSGKISVSLKACEGCVELTVRDTGVGIPEDELPRLFERFYRVKETRGRTIEGTGIGLALVQELVKLHGGNMGVESKVEEGSQFVVRIPLGTAHLNPAYIGQASARSSAEMTGDAFVLEALRWLPDDAQPNKEPIKGVDKASSSLSSFKGQGALVERARIVWADDNADMRDYVTRLLEKRYEIEAVCDGQEALAIIKNNPPDLVLCDRMMPHLNGLELLRAIRLDEKVCSIPVILHSPQTDESAKIEGLEAGADDYLVKPFSARELVARVQSHIEMGNMRTEMNRVLLEASRETEFRNFANMAPAMLWTTNADMVTTFVSQEWYEFTGFSKNLNINEHWIETIHLEDREKAFAIYQNANAKQAPFSMTYRLVCFDGSFRWVMVTGHPRFGDKGEFLGYIGAIGDIHELKLAEQEQKEYAQELTQLNEELLKFAYVASHELQEPLHVVSRYVQLLEQDYKGTLNADADEYIHYAVDGVKRMEMLIDGLLAYARLSIDAKPYEMVNLNDVIDKVCANLKLPIEENKAEITHDELPYLAAQETQMIQLFQNLIGNAIKFRSELAPKIHIGVQQTEDGWQFSVSDNGQGIDPKYFKRIFLIFKRLNRAEPRFGIGTGLTICKKIVERHGGKIWVDSKIGCGATFYFTFSSESVV